MLDKKILKELSFRRGACKVCRQLPPYNVRPVSFVPPDCKDVEGFYAVWPFIVHKRFVQQDAGTCTCNLQLDFDQQRYFSIHEFQHFCEQGDPVSGLQKLQFGQLLVGFAANPGICFAHAAECAVVEHHDFPILCNLDVKLNSVAGLDGSSKGRQRIFGNPLLMIEQPSVGITAVAERGRFFPPWNPWSNQKKICSDEGDSKYDTEIKNSTAGEYPVYENTEKFKHFIMPFCVVEMPPLGGRNIVAEQVTIQDRVLHCHRGSEQLPEKILIF